MAKNLLVINVDIRETRVALIENGIIAELHIERETSRGTLGNIYLGKVSRVLPGMQAAFIDVGLERAAFLHVEDLIRPDDFEAYLAGHRHGSQNDEDRASGPTHEDAAAREAAKSGPAVPSIPSADEAHEEAHAQEEAGALDHDEAHASEGEGAEAGDAHHAGEASGEPISEPETTLPTALDVDDAGGNGALHHAADGDDEDEVVPEGHGDAAGDEPEASAADEEADEAAAHGGEEDAEAAEAADASSPAGGDVAEEAAVEASAGEPPAAPIETATVGGELVVKVPEEDGTTPKTRGRRGRGRDSRVRRRGSTKDRQPALVTEAAEAKAAPAPQQRREGGDRRRGDDRGGQGRRDGRRQGGGGGGDRSGRDERSNGGGRDAKRHAEPPRVSKATPIREVVREGQEVIVQISKEPIGTKGARVTSHVSLPGRYVVYLPTVDHVGISKRIGSDKERSRLREAMDAMKPPTGGIIVRTLAEGLTKKQLKADVGYLVRLWGEVAKKRESGVRAPTCLYTELDLVLKTARDLFTDDIEKIVIDSPDEHHRLQRFVEMFLPERAGAIELYEGEEPIFDAYGIEDEIQRAQSRKVPLPSGGHLIIDQAEALTAIDVNTGRFVGKGSKDLEETILATNLEAVEEIAYQLRFRNIGGLIILDLIDMERAQNREKVRRRLEELLSKDKAKTTLNRISDLGLIEMTRKRTRESLGRTVLEPCFYCDGTGQLQSKQTIAYEILRQIRRERANLPGYVIIVNAHPAVVDLLKSDERIAVQEAERLFQRRLELIPRKEYHLEQFDLQGR